MAVNERRVAVLGAGTIGEALIAGLLSGGWRQPGEIVATGRREERAVELREKLGVEATLSNAEAVAEAALIVIAVKPQDFDVLLDEIAPVVALDAIVFDELENCQGHVTGHYRSGDSQEQAEPGQYSHAIEMLRVHKALYHSNPCSAQSQRNGEAVLRRFISANEWLNPVLVECASGFDYNVCRVRRKFLAKLS